VRWREGGYDLKRPSLRLTHHSFLHTDKKRLACTDGKGRAIRLLPCTDMNRGDGLCDTVLMWYRYGEADGSSELWAPVEFKVRDPDVRLRPEHGIGNVKIWDPWLVGACGFYLDATLEFHDEATHEMLDRSDTSSDLREISR